AFTLRDPVLFDAGSALAVGADEEGLFGVLFHGGVGAEMEAGVLRVAVEADLVERGRQNRVELDQLAARKVVDGQFTLLVGEELAVLAVPGDLQSVPAEERAGLGREDLLVGRVLAVAAVPDVGLLAIAIGDVVEAEVNAAMVRVLA